MRVSIPESCSTAKVLRGYVTKAGYLITDSFWDYKINLVEKLHTSITTIDSVDCPFERKLVNELEMQGIGKILLKRAGGNRSDREVTIEFDAANGRAVEIGVLNALLKEVGPRKTPFWKTLFPALVLSLLTSSVYAQPVNQPIVRFWDGISGVAVAAGDTSTSAVRTWCVFGCWNGTGGDVDVNDRAGRLLGRVYGSQGNQLLQRAGTFDLQVQLRTAGAEYDARTIRALTSTDVVTVNNNFLTDAQLRASPVPVSGTVALSNSFLLDATFTGRINTQGQKTMAGSTPVTFASDQSALSVTATNSFLLDATFTGRINTQGQKAMAASTPVVLSSDQSKIPINISQTTTDNDIDVISEIPGTGATNLGKAEDAGHTSADTGVMALNVVNEGATEIVSADLDYSPVIVDRYGVQLVRNDHPNRWSASAFSTAIVLTEIKAAPAAGFSIYITDISYYNSIASTAVADAQPNLKYGTGANCVTGTTRIWSCFQSAVFTGCEAHLLTPIKIPAANALCFISTGAGTRLVNLGGFIAR